MVDVSDQLVELSGGDPFAWVRGESEAHQAVHECGLYNAGAPVMQLVSTIARAANARLLLDLGSGLGYSTLWLADAAGPGTKTIGVDDDPIHIERAAEIAAAAGMADRVEYICAPASVAVSQVGAVDFVHDDAWFARQPAHLDAMIDCVRPGGVVTMANWFLLNDALTGEPRNDWARFAGEAWASNTIEYAHSLAARTDIEITWVTKPPLGIANKH